MPTFTRRATVNWKGNLLEGAGDLKAGSGAFSLPVKFPKRISAEAEGETSPEELIAAAHATCYQMVVANVLTKSNASFQGSSVTCTVIGEKSDAGLKVVSSELAVTVQGLSGMDAATFAKTAADAEGKCPVSNALRGNVTITVKASVK